MNMARRWRGRGAAELAAERPHARAALTMLIGH